MSPGPPRCSPPTRPAVSSTSGSRTWSAPTAPSSTARLGRWWRAGTVDQREGARSFRHRARRRDHRLGHRNGDLPGPDTGTPIPGTTTATASATGHHDVGRQPDGSDHRCHDRDQPLALTGLTTGTADVDLGDFVSTPITWRRGPCRIRQRDLTFVAALPDEFVGVVAVTDEATFTDSLGGQVRSSALAECRGDAVAARGSRLVKNVDVPPSGTRRSSSRCG